MRPSNQVIRDFYYPPIQFLCRFCGQSIGKWIGKQLVRLGNFKQLKVTLASGQWYQFTACKDCVAEGISEAHIAKSLINDKHPAQPINMDSLAVVDLSEVL